jgi:uncharacterized protein (UPF0147 family)
MSKMIAEREGSVSDILEHVRYFENDEVLPGNIRAVVRCAGDEITRLRAELAEARVLIGGLQSTDEAAGAKP